MNKAFKLSLLLILYSSFSFAQPLPGSQGSYPQVRIIKSKQPLVIIGSLETNYSSLIIAPDNLKIIKTYTDSLDLVPFGEKGKDGVVLAQLKDKTPLLSLEDVLDYYKVPAQDRTLKVLVNKAGINPDLFLADVKRIEKIEKIKQDITSVMRYSWNKDEQYLNIVTMKD